MTTFPRPAVILRLTATALAAALAVVSLSLVYNSNDIPVTHYGGVIRPYIIYVDDKVSENRYYSLGYSLDRASADIVGMADELSRALPDLLPSWIQRVNMSGTDQVHPATAKGLPWRSAYRVGQSFWSFRPIWGGLIGDIAVVTIPLWAALIAPFWAARARRRRLGKCLECGYEGIGKGAICPECGPPKT
jgi:hypothetical protein